jgi:hypothetical protein
MCFSIVEGVQVIYMVLAVAQVSLSNSHYCLPLTDPSKLELWVVILLTGACVLLAALVSALLWKVIVHRQRRARTPSIEIALQGKYYYIYILYIYIIHNTPIY